MKFHRSSFAGLKSRLRPILLRLLSGAAKIIALLGVAIAPKTPRGRLRRAVVGVLLLAVLAGNFSDARTWNTTADTVNIKLSDLSLPSGLRLPYFPDAPYRLGLDLQGGTHLVYVADMKDVPEDERAEAMSGVRDVIERRVNAFGVSEPIVQVNRSGDAWRLIVDLAGVNDIAEAIRLIGETPILEFKEENTEPARELTAEERKEMNSFNAAQGRKANEVLRKARADGADFAALAKENSQDEATKDNGGDLGFIVPGFGPFAPLVERVVALGLKPGQVLSSLLDIGGEIHIVNLLETKDAGKEARASHILICYDGAERCGQTRSKDEARKLVDDLKARLAAEDFAALARENTDDSGTKDVGGDLGFFRHGVMVQPFDQAAFTLQKGGISEVVETAFGFHLIKKTDERPAFEYRLAHILFDKKEESDYLPAPDPWKNTELSGKHVKHAVLQFTQTNEPQVGIDFNDEGKQLFAELTGRSVGKPIAIFLDGQAISIPTVREPITEGSAVISGNFSIKEAKTLVRRLNAGALPVPVTLESQQSVGASLGRESLSASLKAGLIGFGVVAMFMIVYYGLPGAIAVVALALYSAINLSLYKLIPVTLTLSGIAGFILSIGMAVDANVLIFERLKEELLRGRPLGSALDEGFARAWTSIRDSNVATLISCAVLFLTSSSLIKGFALTLAIGVLVSMFSAITVSRTLLRLTTGWGWLKNPSLYLPLPVRLRKRF